MIQKSRIVAASILALGLGIVGLTVAPASFAGVARSSAESTLNVPPRIVPAPDLAQLQAMDEDSFAEAAADTAGHRRKPAASQDKFTGSQDLMSQSLKDFRDKLIKTREAEELDKLLREYDAKYDTLTDNDLKYVVARLSPLIACRGLIWRMAPLAHKSIPGQESLLASVRSFADQITLFEPDTQWQAYLTFLAIPNAALLQAPAPAVQPAAGQTAQGRDTVRRPDRAFYVENDLADFFSSDLYKALGVAVKRLKALQTTQVQNGRTTPLVFDNEIRFGEGAGSQAFDAHDRYRLIGDAEKYATIAKFERRMAMIAQMAAYNWNGNMSLRSKIGRRLGVDAALSVGGIMDVSGLTRGERVQIAREAKYAQLFALRDPKWMSVAYHHLAMFAEYTDKAWQQIEKEDASFEMLLDPDIFAGRRDQIGRGIATLKNLLPSEKASSGSAQIQGAISGHLTHVNLKAFFTNPPKNLKALMPTVFSYHEDIAALTQVYGADHIKFDNTKSTVQLKIGEKTTEFRNYLYGRAIGWDPQAYADLFPDAKSPTEVADAQRILAETRGGRPIMNSLVMFIK